MDPTCLASVNEVLWRDAIGKVKPFLGIKLPMDGVRSTSAQPRLAGAPFRRLPKDTLDAKPARGQGLGTRVEDQDAPLRRNLRKRQSEDGLMGGVVRVDAGVTEACHNNDNMVFAEWHALLSNCTIQFSKRCSAPSLSTRARFWHVRLSSRPRSAIWIDGKSARAPSYILFALRSAWCWAGTRKGGHFAFCP